MKIFKLLSTLLCVFLFQVNVNAQYYQTIEEVQFYKTRMSANVHSTIPEGVVLKLEDDISLSMVKTNYKGVAGYIYKDVVKDKLKEVEKPVIEDYTIANLTTDKLFVNQDISKDIELLAQYNKVYRNSLTAFYITTSLSVLATTLGSILIVDTYSNDTFGIGVAMITVGSLAGAGSLISGICMMEFQNKVNKQNVKVHLRANGVSVAF